MKTWKFLLSLVLCLSLSAASLAQCPGGNCPNGRCIPKWNPKTPAWKPVAPPERPAQFPAVVHLISQFEGETQSLFSGFIADRDQSNGTAIVVTCAHGYKALMSITVITQDGRKFVSEVLAVDSVQDLCIVRISDPGIPPLEISDSIPKAGDRLYMAGFPGQETVLMGSWGTMVDWYSPDTSGINSFLNCTCQCKSGCSGGPIMNDKGQVVATVTGHFTKDGNTTGPCLAKTLGLIECKPMSYDSYNPRFDRISYPCPTGISIEFWIGLDPIDQAILYRQIFVIRSIQRNYRPHHGHR